MPIGPEPQDAFGAHVLTGVLGTIGDREIGPGHVVLSEERYAWLLAHVPEAEHEPGDLIATVTTGDVNYTYESHARGVVSCFEAVQALAALLANEIVYLNNHWWEEDWPERAQRMTAVIVNCSDVFMWACAEGEDLPFSEVENLYRMWRKDPEWGPAVWCCQQRKEMPQSPVAKRIVEAGIWDLTSMDLAENGYDRLCRERFGGKS